MKVANRKLNRPIFSIWLDTDFTRALFHRTLKELLLARLALGIVEREDDDVTVEKLDKALSQVMGKKVRRCPYDASTPRCTEANIYLSHSTQEFKKGFIIEVRFKHGLGIYWIITDDGIDRVYITIIFLFGASWMTAGIKWFSSVWIIRTYPTSDYIVSGATHA